MKLLLVEDNQRLAERISYHLGKSYVIDVVESGEDALERIRSINYGVILLDLGLPGISGLEVCKNMRLLKFNNPILVLTGNAEMTDRISLLDSILMNFAQESQLLDADRTEAIFGQSFNIVISE
jgi:DNA-binding response OmpR family regulator